jgi:hypothetical protein
MHGRFPSPSRNDRFPWWLSVSIRLLLLAEGLGLWAVVIVIAIAYGAIILYYGIGAVVILLGPALLFGIPALVFALRPGLPRGGRAPVFLLVNTLGAIVTGALAFSQPDPVPYYAVIAVATAGSTLLLLIAIIRPPTPIAACATGAIVVLIGYAATYALPPTVPPAPALHLEGVLSIPASAGSVIRVPGGADVGDRLHRNGTDWITGTVNPGTYRYAQACDGDWDHPTLATVQVPLGTAVTAPDQCPSEGTVRGYVGYASCSGSSPVNCYSFPLKREHVGFQAASTRLVFEVTTDDSGNYTIPLPPGTYTIWNDSGYVLTTNPRVITVESGATLRLNLTFRAAQPSSPASSSP